MLLHHRAKVRRAGEPSKLRFFGGCRNRSELELDTILHELNIGGRPCNKPYSFLAVVRQGDVGVYVSVGGFRRDAEDAARKQTGIMLPGNWQNLRARDLTPDLEGRGRWLI